MTEYDLMQMANDVGVEILPRSVMYFQREALMRLATKVSEAEREECAKVCDEHARGLLCPVSGGDDSAIECVKLCAKEIRARSNSN